MGCACSKPAKSPDFDFSTTTHHVSHHCNPSLLLKQQQQERGGFGELEKIKEEDENEDESQGNNHRPTHQSSKKPIFTFKFGRYTEAEQIAAGWPSWLSAVAAEAIDGWLPLRPDLFQKLDKIGQGTYSSVHRARDVETGRVVALKKVRFDTFQPESVRFMAREILMLRQLDHPNVMKLEGIITNRLSCSIYLVFEYMEHDLSGLLSCSDIKFSDSQIKCYMQQLLAGLEHCHSQGVMHRDIKSSNVLVNNEGILKIADFGLANYISARHRQELTSRVVTLWYRPPELLLGSTDYGASVDMWSLGCVFAELFVGKPILKGRTEVEQLHKIFKLCGSPADEYWQKSKLPLATMFKTQHPYVSCLRERCKEFPKSAVNLLETLLSLEPHKRGTASSALDCEYFSTKPYACDPSSMPKYPPSKEIDAKLREERRSRASGTSRNPRRASKAFQEPSSISKVVPTEEETTTQFTHRNYGGDAYALKTKTATVSRESLKSSYDTVSEASQATEISQADSIRSVPVLTASSGFAWAKKRKGNALSSRLHHQSSSRGPNLSSLNPLTVLHARHTLDSEEQENEEFQEVAKRVMWMQQSQHYHQDSLDTSDLCHSQEFPVVSSFNKEYNVSRMNS